jgi:hypothetical protein
MDETKEDQTKPMKGKIKDISYYQKHPLLPLIQKAVKGVTLARKTAGKPSFTATEFGAIVLIELVDAEFDENSRFFHVLKTAWESATGEEINAQYLKSLKRAIQSNQKPNIVASAIAMIAQSYRQRRKPWLRRRAI